MQLTSCASSLSRSCKVSGDEWRHVIFRQAGFGPDSVVTALGLKRKPQITRANHYNFPLTCRVLSLSIIGQHILSGPSTIYKYVSLVLSRLLDCSWPRYSNIVLHIQALWLLSFGNTRRASRPWASSQWCGRASSNLRRTMWVDTCPWGSSLRYPKPPKSGRWTSMATASRLQCFTWPRWRIWTMYCTSVASLSSKSPSSATCELMIDLPCSSWLTSATSTGMPTWTILCHRPGVHRQVFRVRRRSICDRKPTGPSRLAGITMRSRRKASWASQLTEDTCTH